MAIVNLLVIALVCGVLVDAAPEYPKLHAFTQSTREKVECNHRNIPIREELIRQAKCGPPREVFVTLKRAHHEEIEPSAVWINRCKGTCPSGECHPTKVKKRIIPIYVTDVKSQKEMCSNYEIEEHLECACCSQHNCGRAQVFNPRKCSCQCPNTRERRSCLRKRNMRWNRSKCTCEPRRKQ